MSDQGVEVDTEIGENRGSGVPQGVGMMGDGGGVPIAVPSGRVLDAVGGEQDMPAGERSRDPLRPTGRGEGCGCLT